MIDAKKDAKSTKSKADGADASVEVPKLHNTRALKCKPSAG